MKTCPQCGHSYPLSRVLCVPCNEILDEKPYLRLVWVTLAIAFAFHFVLARFGYAGHGIVKETFMTEAFLLIISVLVWKGAQKWRTPQRRVLYELASLYSDRWGRLLVLGITLFALLAFSGVLKFNADRLPEPTAVTGFRLIRIYVILGLGAFYVLVVFGVQKFAFFDFRLQNSLVRRELNNAESVG